MEPSIITYAVGRGKELCHVSDENGASVSAISLILSLFMQYIKGLVVIALFSVMLKTLPSY